jgi:hypothetical protein
MEVYLLEGFRLHQPVNCPDQLYSVMVGMRHRLDMEVDLLRLFGLHVHSCTHCLRPATSPLSPALVLVYEGAIRKDKRHLFLTP